MTDLAGFQNQPGSQKGKDIEGARKLQTFMVPRLPYILASLCERELFPYLISVLRIVKIFETFFYPLLLL